MNTLGRTFRLTTFGESHGPAMGGIIDGCPPGISLDMEMLEDMLSRRRPGTSRYVTARKEEDIPEFLSGLTSGDITLGTPIGFIIRNKDARPSDYDAMAELYRPNHADYTYMARYGLRDVRGGGRASARETVNWVVGGAVAGSFLKTKGISVSSRLVAVGGVEGSIEDLMTVVEQARRAGDSVGGVVECCVEGMPAGIGSPVFGKLHADLAAGLMGINGVKGVEYGDGFEAARSYGSIQADAFAKEEGSVVTLTNHSGGIQGGISNGMPIVLRIAFKPTPTIARPLPTITTEGAPAVLESRGRHDPCIALRGAVVAEAVTLLTLADAILSR